MSLEQTAPPESRARDFFSPLEWGVFVLLIAGGLLLRWFALDMRPFHHDESLHGMYGKYFFDFPDQNYYRYQALLHGPFLYNLYRIVYNTLGQGDWASRVPINFVGSCLIFVPFLFRHYFSRFAVLALTAAVALSPTLIYWSRFLREDTLIIACMVAMLYGATLAAPGRKALIFFVALTLQFCIKENAYVTVAILFGYLVFEYCFAAQALGDKNPLFAQMARHIKTHSFAVLNAVCLGVFIYCYLYSAGFRYMQGILDGLYRESLGYWMHQHNIDRITGPWLFHFYMLSWYELAFIVAFGLYLWTFYRSAARWVQVCGVVIFVMALVVSLYLSDKTIADYKYLGLLKLKDAYDVCGFLILVPQAVLTTVVHLLERNRRLAFFGYLFLANFCTYSYLGEKVPWLTTYPFIAGLIYLALYFDDYFRRFPVSDWQHFSVARLIRSTGIIVLVLGVLFTADEGSPENLFWVASGVFLIVLGMSFRAAGMLGTVNLKWFLLALFCIYTTRAAILTNYVYAGEAREYISQVHTTQEIHGIANTIKEEIATETKGYKPQLLVMGESTWPMTWYMRDIPQYKFQAPAEEYAKFDYIIRDWKDNEPPAPEQFRAQRINLRGWWVPDLRLMTLKRFLGYSLNHTPWSPVGYSYAWFLVNPKANANPEAQKPQ
ncbi:MAG: TIGR03663 family protein [Deltaproteobacteria bacterium]|nr:TIGR03663 family protein [Deltaproteobacteria bacterium]